MTHPTLFWWLRARKEQSFWPIAWVTRLVQEKHIPTLQACHFTFKHGKGYMQNWPACKSNAHGFCQRTWTKFLTPELKTSILNQWKIKIKLMLRKFNNQSLCLSVSLHHKVYAVNVSIHIFWLRPDNFSHFQQGFYQLTTHQVSSVDKSWSSLKSIKDILQAWVPSSFKRSCSSSISTFVSFKFFRLALDYSAQSSSAFLLSLFTLFEVPSLSVGNQSTINLSKSFVDRPETKWWLQTRSFSRLCSIKSPLLIATIHCIRGSNESSGLPRHDKYQLKVL